jgi:uncharacterized protein YbjT (DUF2867 family)
MSTPSLLIAGAGGAVGRHLVEQCRANKSHSLRLLTRSKKKMEDAFSTHSSSQQTIVEADVLRPETLAGVCKGVDTVISTIGASLDFRAIKDRNSFTTVDLQGNLHLLEEARKSGVRKFVYLSAFGAATMNTAYTNAHEEFVRHLKVSGLEYGVVRPTGFFYVNNEFLEMARNGTAWLVGDGRATTNPIHEEDVAKACTEAALGQGNQEMNIGGPETFTRQEIAELAFQTLGKKPRVFHSPFAMTKVMKPLVSIFNPRIGDLVEFLGYVATHECVAPPYGQKRLGDYFLAKART